jgi:hypothetical protein
MSARQAYRGGVPKKRTNFYLIKIAVFLAVQFFLLTGVL